MSTSDQHDALIARLKAARLAWLSSVTLIFLSLIATARQTADSSEIRFFGWSMTPTEFMIIDGPVQMVLLIAFVIHATQLGRQSDAISASELEAINDRVPWLLTSGRTWWIGVLVVVVAAVPALGLGIGALNDPWYDRSDSLYWGTLLARGFLYGNGLLYTLGIVHVLGFRFWVLRATKIVRDQDEQTGKEEEDEQRIARARARFTLWRPPWRGDRGQGS